MKKGDLSLMSVIHLLYAVSAIHNIYDFAVA